MARYRAYITTGRAPALQHNDIERASLRGLASATREQLARLAIEWPDLELPRALKLGHYFKATKAGADIEIYKVRG